MRKTDFRNNHQKFDDWIWSFNDFIGDLVTDRRGGFSKSEKRELIEASVHRVCARWHNLVELDVVTSLNRDSTRYAKELDLRLRKHLTRDECEAVLFGHRYLDFRSVGDIKTFGKKHLIPTNNPFAAISPKIGETIDDFFVIRNLLSHYSRYAQRRYERRLRKKHTFKRLPQPGDYLLAVDRSTKMMRWTGYLEAFMDASKVMRKRVC